MSVNEYYYNLPEKSWANIRQSCKAYLMAGLKVSQRNGFVIGICVDSPLEMTETPATVDNLNDFFRLWREKVECCLHNAGQEYRFG